MVLYCPVTGGMAISICELSGVGNQKSRVEVLTTCQEGQEERLPRTDRSQIDRLQTVTFGMLQECKNVRP
jgi:hypothetical protein